MQGIHKKYVKNIKNLLAVFIFLGSLSFFISIRLGADENVTTGMPGSTDNSADNSTTKSQDKGAAGSLIGQMEVPFEIFMGRKLYSTGKYKEASKFLQAAYDKNEASAEDMALLGICYIKLNNKTKAEEVLKAALKLDKNSFAVYMGMGTLYFEKKDFKNAFQYFSHAHNLKKSSFQAVKGMSASLINLGVVEYARADKKKAEEIFKQALKLKPKSVPALRNLGIVYADTDREKKAVEAYREALKISPDDPVVLRLLSEVLKKLGEDSELYKVLKKLSAVQPYNPYSYENLGLIYDEKGEGKKAEEYFLKAVKYGSEDAYPYYRAAQYFLKYGNRKKAHSNLVLAVGKAVHRIGAIQLQAAGRIKQKKGKLNKEDIEQLKKYSDIIEKPQKILADSIKLLRKTDDSNAVFRKDIEKLSSWYPHSIALKESYAEVLEEEGNYPGALKVWQSLEDDHPTDVRAHIGAAEIYSRMGRTDNAIFEYRKALDLDSKNESVFKNLYSLYRKSGKTKELFNLLEDRYLRDKRNRILLKYLILLAGDMGRGKDEDFYKKELNRISGKQPLNKNQ